MKYTLFKHKLSPDATFPEFIGYDGEIVSRKDAPLMSEDVAMNVASGIKGDWFVCGAPHDDSGIDLPQVPVRIFRSQLGVPLI